MTSFRLTSVLIHKKTHTFGLVINTLLFVVAHQRNYSISIFATAVITPISMSQIKTVTTGKNKKKTFNKHTHIPRINYNKIRFTSLSESLH